MGASQGERGIWCWGGVSSTDGRSDLCWGASLLCVILALSSLTEGSHGRGPRRLLESPTTRKEDVPLGQSKYCFRLPPPACPQAEEPAGDRLASGGPPGRVRDERAGGEPSFQLGPALLLLLLPLQPPLLSVYPCPSSSSLSFPGIPLPTTPLPPCVWETQSLFFCLWFFFSLFPFSHHCFSRGLLHHLLRAGVPGIAAGPPGPLPLCSSTSPSLRLVWSPGWE